MTRPPAPLIPLQANERETLNAFLDFYRAALLDRAYGLDDAQLQVALPPSTLTLSRLIAHMARVECQWFGVRLDGEDLPEPWASLDLGGDNDAEMSLGQTWSRSELLTNFEAAVADSRTRSANHETLDVLSAEVDARTGDHWSLRWILVHMIEEYARHCGHADLIRESIDGDVLS